MKRELQIEIDDVYACAGSCPGCALSSSERMTNKPDMPVWILEQSLRKLNTYINNLHSRAPLDEVSLTYGIGDHFRVDINYIKLLAEMTNSFFSRIGLPYDSKTMFLTTSLVGKKSKVKEYLKVLSEIKGVQIIPIAVLDPILLRGNKRFSEDYFENIKLTREFFSRTDLQINISDDVIRETTPQEVVNFAKENKFKEVTINWVPNQHNILNTTLALPHTTQWLIEFALLLDNEEIDTSYVPVLEKCINIQKNSSRTETSEFILNNAKETYELSIQIDHEGHVFPKMEAIGDVPFNSRFGYPDCGNISTSSIEECVDTGIQKISKALMKELLSKPCSECQFNKACFSGGFFAYSKILNQKGECINPVKSIFVEMTRPSEMPA